MTMKKKLFKHFVNNLVMSILLKYKILNEVDQSNVLINLSEHTLNLQNIYFNRTKIKKKTV